MPVSMDDVRALALALPGVTEQDHHGMPSFRVHGKIVATVPDESHLRVMLDEAGIRTAVAETPAVCQEFYWGTRLACVVVDLTAAPAPLVQDLLNDAWRRRTS